MGSIYNPSVPRPAIRWLLLFPALFLPACNTPTSNAASPILTPAPLSSTAPDDPNRGMLDIQTDPSGASVTVDGKAMGTTPLVVKGLSIQHPITVEVSWPGWRKPQTQTVDWQGHDLIQMRLKKSKQPPP